MVKKIHAKGPANHPVLGPVPMAYEVEFERELVLPENLGNPENEGDPGLEALEWRQLDDSLQWSDQAVDTIPKQRAQIMKRGYNREFRCRFCDKVQKYLKPYTRRDTVIKHESKCCSPGGPKHRCNGCPDECPGAKECIPPPRLPPGPKRAPK